MADNGDLEARIAAAVEFARAQEARFNAEAAAAETSAESLARTAQSFTYNAIRATLEEITTPGKHTADLPAPPFAGDLADAPPHPEEPRR